MAQTPGGTPVLPQQSLQLVAVLPDFATAYARALRDKKPLVMFFYDKSSFSEKEREELQQLRADPIFSQVFLFGESSLPEDQLGFKAATRLTIKFLPAISIFESNSSELKELSRHEGVWTVAELRKQMSEDMCHAFETHRVDLDGWTLFILGCPTR